MKHYVLILCYITNMTLVFFRMLIWFHFLFFTKYTFSAVTQNFSIFLLNIISKYLYHSRGKESYLKPFHTSFSAQTIVHRPPNHGVRRTSPFKSSLNAHWDENTRFSSSKRGHSKCMCAALYICRTCILLQYFEIT